VLAIQQAEHELLGTRCIQLAGCGSELSEVGFEVQLLCLELRRDGAASASGLTQLAEAGLQPRERCEFQLLARSLPLLLCPRVLAPGCCSSLLRAPSTGAGCVRPRRSSCCRECGCNDALADVRGVGARFRICAPQAAPAPASAAAPAAAGRRP
jgi:hypothetical protein